MSEELDDADFGVALDIIDVRMKCLELAASEEKLEPSAVLVLADYYFNWLVTNLIVPYPISPDGKVKKPRAVQ